MVLQSTSIIYAHPLFRRVRLHILALVIQHEKRMLRTVLDFAALQATTCYALLSLNRQDFRENFLTILFLIFSTIFSQNVSRSKRNSEKCYHKFIQIFI
jgi:hypothetical protein